MTDELTWGATRRAVYERAQGCCEYCQTCENNTGQSMHIEHINPNAGDGLENLCLSCANCNLSKATVTTAPDPISEQVVPLFNPRLDRWSDHFRWAEDKAMLTGITPTGRATIARLKVNQERIVGAQRRWVEAGYHPLSLS